MVLNSYFVIVCFFVNNDFHVFARHICPRAPHRSACVRPFCFSNKLKLTTSGHVRTRSMNSLHQSVSSPSKSPLRTFPCDERVSVPSSRETCTRYHGWDTSGGNFFIIIFCTFEFFKLTSFDQQKFGIL